jgi:anti-sigma regulatory factor (Ser/Thr protein kinase)
VPSRAPATSLKEAKIGDLGIHLMRSFANEMRYGRSGGRNQLTLLFLEPEAKSPG